MATSRGRYQPTAHPYTSACIYEVVASTSHRSPRRKAPPAHQAAQDEFGGAATELVTNTARRTTMARAAQAGTAYLAPDNVAAAWAAMTSLSG